MKLDPINLILNKEFDIECSIFFVSGNEISLINKIKDLLIYNLTKNELIETKKIINIKLVDQNLNLFNKKKLFIVSEAQGIDEGDIRFLEKNDNKFIFILENSAKNNIIKKKILKNKKISVIDCYELNKDSKIKILNDYLNNNKIKIEKELFWYLLDMLDNRYMFLKKELHKIRELDSKSINYKNLKKIITKDEMLDEKIFFKLLDNNEKIIDNYNLKITNQNEANKLYLMIKKFTSLIIDNQNQSDFENSIPKYLFREKKVFLTIYKKFNPEKKDFLIKLLFNTDVVMRKNINLSEVVCLRFLLNLRKIIIS